MELVDYDNNVFVILLKDKYEFNSSNKDAKVLYRSKDIKNIYDFYMRESVKLDPKSNMGMEIQDRFGIILKPDEIKKTLETQTT